MYGTVQHKTVLNHSDSSNMFENLFTRKAKQPLKKS